MNYSKVREVKSPTRGTSKSAGVDLYIPEFNDSFIQDFLKKNPDISLVRENNYNSILFGESIIIGPQQRILIPSGIKANIASNRALVVKNKSGVGSKLGLDRLAELIDEDYTGEIHINLVNTTSNIVEIKSGQKIIQLVEIPVYYSEWTEVPEDQLFVNFESDRGDRGFGSTDKK